MYPLSIHKITIFTLSIFLWLVLSPYIIWERNYIYSIFFSIVFLTLLLDISNKPIKITSFILSTIIVFFIFIFMGLNGASVGWSIITSFTIFILLLYSQQNINKIFHIFKLIFVLSLIPSILLWILHIIGFDITSLAIGIHEAPNPIKTASSQYYLIFPGASTLNYMLESPILRLQGMYDEPGIVGTIGGLILIADKMDFNKKLNIIIFIAGLMSLSLAFYIIIMIYYLLTIKRNIKSIVMPIIIALLVFMLLPSNIQRQIEERTIDRFHIDSHLQISGYNRESKDSNNWDNWKQSNIKEFLFGLNNMENDGSSSWKNVLIKSGYIGFLILVLIYMLLFYYKIHKINYNHFVFVLLFILAFIQRPYILTPSYILIFIYALQNLQKDKNIISQTNKR